MSFCVSQSEQEIGLILAVTLYAAVRKRNNNLVCLFVCSNPKLEVMSDVTLYIIFHHISRGSHECKR
jgi:hypothetical protein